MPLIKYEIKKKTTKVYISYIESIISTDNSSTEKELINSRISLLVCMCMCMDN